MATYSQNFANESTGDLLNRGVQYFEFTQPGGSFFVCTLSASQLVNRFDIRRRSEHPEDGIQRDDDKKRIADIASYARTEEAIFPTPIILSAKSEDFVFENGYLRAKEVESRSSLGHVLDGQHRLLGLRSADPDTLDRIQLLVVFAFDIDRYAEAMIFATINGNQRQVPKSLMYDLFALHPGRSVEKTCHEIVKSLNEDITSPFFGRIKVLGRKADDSETLSQAAFVDHVKRLIDGDKSPLRNMYLAKEDWAVRKIVANYFQSIDESVSEHHPGVEIPLNFFYKTTGFGGALQALNALAKGGVQAGDLSKDWFRPITDQFVADFRLPAGVGNSAMIDVRVQILNAAERVTQLPLI
jgi:DGQHR domain-containing protein